MELSKKQLLENKQLLKEDAIETALMAAGFIPVIGEVFDIILIIRYIIKKEYLYAGLMLIALIPTVGDFIVKPFLGLLKGVKGGGKIVLSGAEDIVKLTKANPKLASEYLKVEKYLSNPKIGQLIKQVENVPVVGGKWASGMSKAISENKIAVTEIKGLSSLPKTIGKEIAAGGKFSGGLKTFFQERALAKYVEKKGMAPSTWLSNWWNVVRKGRKDRISLVKKFVVANGILDFFGLPSFEAFQHKMETDENFRNKLANDPKFSQVVNQSGMSQSELSTIENQEQSSEQGGGIGKTFMNLAMIKTLAKLYT
jgi:hypothetical protein